MVVFVVLYWLQKTFSIETVRTLQIWYNFLVLQVRPLYYFVSFTIFNYCVWALSLDDRRQHVEAWGVWPMKLVPGMLPYLFNCNSLIWISNKDLWNHVFGIVRQKLGQVVFRIQNLLVQIRRLLVLIWQIAAQHGVQYHTTAPQITHQPTVSMTRNHLYENNENNLKNAQISEIFGYLPQVRRNMDFHKRSWECYPAHTDY